MIRSAFLRHLPRWLFGISSEEATFACRGFREGDAGACQRLEKIGYTFLEGYHAALDDTRPDSLALALDLTEEDFRGFAFEGAAMALALLDLLTPWHKKRLQAFLAGPGAAHVYMVHVGAGWALARLRRRIGPESFPTLEGKPVKGLLGQLDPLLGWLVVDGYGFHEGYFHWPRYVEKQVLPKRLTGYARRVFDQGLGRSLWFVDGADVDRLPATIAAFHRSRQADLWSGVGLACAYAGGADHAAIEALRIAAGPYQIHLVQGAAFAAKARQRAGNPAPHTALTCEILCNLSADAAADVTDVALQGLAFDGAQPAYEVWRQRIQQHLKKARIQSSE